MSAIARFWSAAAQAAAAEAAWHWLGPAWAFGLAVLLIAWHLPAAVMPASGAALEKARAVEKRLNAVVGQIPAPQTSPGPHSDSSYTGSNSSYGASNSSYGMSGGTVVSYNDGSGNNGGSNSNTSGQIGGAAAHYHSMTHYHTSSSSLESWANALRGSHSDLVPAVNALRQSHSDLVPLVNTLVGSHQTLSDKLNTAIGRLETSGLFR